MKGKKKSTQKKRFKKSLKALQYIMNNQDFQSLEIFKRNLNEFYEDLKKM